MTGKPEESLERLSRLMVEMTDVARLLQKALDTGHAQGLLYDSVLPCMKELTTLVPALLSDRDKLAAEVERLTTIVQALEQVTVGPLSYAAMRAAKEAAEAKLSALEGAARPFLPITYTENQDYAELTFGEHQTQAMTMAPLDWTRLSAALASLDRTVPAEEGRLREVLEAGPPGSVEAQRAFALPAEGEGKAVERLIAEARRVCSVVRSMAHTDNSITDFTTIGDLERAIEACAAYREEG